MPARNQVPVFSMRQRLWDVLQIHRLRPLALSVIVLCAYGLSCVSHQPLYVYRAYQDPKSTRGPYYLREALVVAPDHAAAMRIIAAAMTEIHPSWSGPIYVTLVGVSEKQRKPGLLGGPVWLASTKPAAGSQLSPDTRVNPQSRGNVPVGQPGG